MLAKVALARPQGRGSPIPIDELIVPQISANPGLTPHSMDRLEVVDAKRFEVKARRPQPTEHSLPALSIAVRSCTRPSVTIDPPGPRDEHQSANRGCHRQDRPAWRRSGEVRQKRHLWRDTLGSETQRKLSDEHSHPPGDKSRRPHIRIVTSRGRGCQPFHASAAGTPVAVPNGVALFWLPRLETAASATATWRDVPMIAVAVLLRVCSLDTPAKPARPRRAN